MGSQSEPLKSGSEGRIKSRWVIEFFGFLALSLILSGVKLNPPCHWEAGGNAMICTSEERAKEIAWGAVFMFESIIIIMELGSCYWKRFDDWQFKKFVSFVKWCKKRGLV